MADSTQSQNLLPRNQEVSPSRDYQRAWKEKNPNKGAEYQARYRAKNLAKCKEREKSWRDQNREYRRSKRLQVRYGLTAEQYDAALAKQDGGCAICRLPSRDGRRLAVDHCHYTGKLRGLLCFHCNTAIGNLGDSAEKVARAVEYLRSGEI